jgi:hypothetical protein
MSDVLYRGMRLPDPYTGVKDTASPNVVFRADGTELTPHASLKVRNHSPTGFSWGYGGSGPSQLALAILLDYAPHCKAKIERRYQDFKREFVSRWGEAWELTRAELDKFLFEDQDEDCQEEDEEEDHV